MEFVRWRCLKIAAVLLNVEGLLCSGHRPSIEQGDGGTTWISSLHMEPNIGSPCKDEDKAKCCPTPALADKASTVDGCGCACLKVNYEDEFKKVESRYTWYKKAGYPVDNKSAHPDYQQYANNHIAPQWTTNNAKQKGVLAGVTMPEANAKVGSQFEAWDEKWKSGFDQDGHSDNVPVKEKFENAKKLLTNQAASESDKLKIGDKSVPLIEDSYPYNASEALKGQWRHEIQSLGMDAFNMRMMAEEELLALRDFLLKACVNCNEKVKAAKDDLTQRRETYEREAAARASSGSSHEEHTGGSTSQDHHDS